MYWLRHAVVPSLFTTRPWWITHTGIPLFLAHAYTQRLDGDKNWLTARRWVSQNETLHSSFRQGFHPAGFLIAQNFKCRCPVPDTSLWRMPSGDRYISWISFNHVDKERGNLEARIIMLLAMSILRWPQMSWARIWICKVECLEYFWFCTQ